MSNLQVFSFSDIINWMHYPPGSMFFILLLSIGVALISALLTKWLTNPKELAAKQQKIKEHQDRKKEIEKLKDTNPKKYIKEMTKWKRQDAAIQKMQQKMSLQRLKPTCVTFVPMLIIFYVLRGFYGTGPVAIPPMNPWNLPMVGKMMWGFVPGKIGPEMGMINFTTWYFLCSFATNTIIQKLMGLAQPGGGFGNMFDQSQFTTK